MKIYLTIKHYHGYGKYKHKKAKVYKTKEGQYILYDGIHVPMTALTFKGHDEILEMDCYEFNAFTYFYEN